MASSSSLTLSQAILSRSTTHPHGSSNQPPPSDHRLSLPTFSLPTFSGLKSSSLPTTTASGRRLTSRRRAIRASAAVETLNKTETALVDKSVNTIRFLAIDAVEKANSGHPGLPMGCAPMGHILYDEIMRYNPKNPCWFNRDRFVLSAGHGCMLQYALLHLAGYDSVQEEDLKGFRQWGSKTPGHPENFETPGVEVTTGPLGQGIANAVGLALAERHLAARFNKPDSEIVDHYTYVILGDGCQMEGIANEACSLAGHWGLGKLIAFYDDNHISIDGDTEIAFTECVDTRFEGLGWHVIWVKNGNTGYDEIRAAIKEAKTVTDKPTLIKVTTTIGFGSPNKANSYSVHGSALGAKEVDATRKNLGWPYEPFHVPEDVKKHWSRHVPEGAALEAEWNAKFAEYEKKYKEEAAELKSIISGELPAGWEKALPTYTPESPADATRNLSQQCLNALAKVLPGFLGGSADLASSNMTLLKMFGDFQKNTPEERNLRFGVREHGMGAICNGIDHHTPGLIPYCATFFVFTDYMRAAIRISALSEAGVIYVMTHDSIGLGEDGPTHQPVEHLASFRAMPNVLMLRPADGNETAGAYKVAVLNRKRPSILALSRQKLSHLPGTSVEGVEKGGYTVSDNSLDNKPDVILMGTGSELEIASKAADELRKEGKAVRVVSFISWELFDEQSDAYKDSVLPAAVTARVSIEAGSTFGWTKHIGSKGKAIGIDRFGASAPAGKIAKAPVFPALELILPCMLTRADALLYSWYAHPDFSKFVAGAFVRVVVSSHPETVYRLARVIGTVTGHTYELRSEEGAAGEPCNVYLDCAIAGVGKSFPLNAVSNQPPVERDLERYCQACVEKQYYQGIPRKSDMEEASGKLKQLRSETPHYEASHVSELVKSRGQKPLHQQMIELTDRLRLAQDRHNVDEVKEIAEKLSELKSRMAKKQTTPMLPAGRQRRKDGLGASTSSLDKATMMKEELDEHDVNNPFVRAETLPTMVFYDPNEEKLQQQKAATPSSSKSASSVPSSAILVDEDGRSKTIQRPLTVHRLNDLFDFSLFFQ